LIGTLSKSWWLLAVCGVLDAMHAILNLLMLNPDGSLSLRSFGMPGAVWDMGVLAIAAGACAVAAGVRNSGRDNSWLLVLHGFALGAFGLIAISPLVRGPLSFRPVSLLFVVMALSIGAFALAAGRTWRGSTSDGPFLRVAGSASIGFALSFIAVGFQLIRLGPPYAFFVWMSCYFGFSAVFMLWLAFRARSQGLSKPDRTEPLSLPSPWHAH